jgi:hypothetical protein
MDGEVVTLTDEAKTIDLTFLENEEIQGFFSVQPVTSGTGTLKIEYLTSNENIKTSFKVPYLPDGSAMGDIVTAHPAGIEVYGFSPTVSAFSKIRLTATGEVTVSRLVFCAK